MNTAVYYPHFHPTAGWLRRASLLWEQVHVLDPFDRYIRSSELYELDSALGGVLQPIDVWRLHGDELAEPILEGLANWLDLRADEISDRVKSKESFEDLDTLLPRSKVPEGPIVDLMMERGVLRVDERSFEVEMPDWEVDEHYAQYMEAVILETPPEPGSDHEKYTQLTDLAHAESAKGNPAKADKLLEQAAAIRRRNLVTIQDHSTDYRLPADLAREYLALCASTVAAADGRDVVSAGARWIEPIMSSEPALRGEVAMGTLELVLPDSIDTIDNSALADFRNESATHRFRWQAEVQQLVGSYAAAASVDTYLTARDQLVEIANEQLEETKRLYRSAQIRTATEVLSISLTPPALATFAASALGIGLIAPIGLSAALSLVAVEKVLDWRHTQRNHRNSPWSYILDVEDLG